MGGIGGLVRWDGRQVAATELAPIVERIRHRGPDGLAWRVDGCIGLGCARLALEASECESPCAPAWHQESECGAVADARLFKRSDLKRDLSGSGWLPRHPTNAELILAAYQRWGVDFVQHLDGDYACAVWDGQQRRLLLARDPFGVRGLFFHQNSDFVVFGSEPKQILMHPEVPVEADDEVVANFLLQRFADTSKTFFSSVRRLKPGHLLVATNSGVRTKRYWNPDPGSDDNSNSRGRNTERFRELLIEAVRKRLDTDFPVMAQLSGGLDSSSIVVAAAEIYRGRPSGLPSFETLSEVFPGLPCDESRYIDSVTSRVPFKSHSLTTSRDRTLEEIEDEIWLLDCPFLDIQRGPWLGELDLLSSLEARTLLTGYGGDELLEEEFYLFDLAKRRRYFGLLSEAWRKSRWSSQPFTGLVAGALRFSAPESFKRFARYLRSTASTCPSWASPHLGEVSQSRSVAEEVRAPDFPSLTQEGAFHFLPHPDILWGMESLAAQTAKHGIWITHPFMDRPLVEATLAIPFRDRLPKGRSKALLREGLSDLLPAQVRDRREGTVFDSLNTMLFQRNGSVLADRIFGDGRWHQSDYTNGAQVEAFFTATLEADRPDLNSIESLWRIAMLELWLRNLSRYNE